MKLMFKMCIILITALVSAHDACRDKIQHNNIQYIHYRFTDVTGAIKSVIRPVSFLDNDLKHGIDFDGSSIPGCKQITKSDMTLIPDISTVNLVPWTNAPFKAASVICDMQANNKPYENDSRYILKKALQEASDLGLEFLVGPEIEFFLFKDQRDSEGNLVPIDSASYCDSARDLNGESLQASILSILHAFEVAPEKVHHEVAPGQYEVSLHYGPALTIADNVIITRHALKTIAQSAGLKLSFMPKPLKNMNGSGMHIHFSIRDIKTGKNLFYDNNDPHCLSSLAKSFLAGILNRAQEITLLLNPTINSYKRLIPGYEAPIHICCGSQNRSALIRLPELPRQISSDDDISTFARAEIRSPDGLCNPYLAFACILKAGLEGFKNKEHMDPIINDNFFDENNTMIQAHHIKTLPAHLNEAIKMFETSHLMRELLGESLHSYFIKSKQSESHEYHATISEWEQKKYLNF